MSSYKKCYYEPCFEEKVQTNPQTRAVSKHNKKKLKKVNKTKILFLGVLFCFLLFPCLNMYNYLFFNKLHNNGISVKSENFVNKSDNLLANTSLLNKNFVGNVALKKPQMDTLELNKTMNTLQSNVQYLINQYPRLKAGVFIWDYETKNYVNINGDMQIPAASIIKVPILLQMFKRIESGNLDLYEKFNMTSYYRTGGSGYLQYRPEGAEFEMNDLANFMIRTSDNTATNMILSAVGGMNEMNIALRNWGFAKTHLSTWLPDLYGTNVTTPKDMATILYNSDNPKFLSLENRSRIVEIMSRVKNTSLLKQGIPDSAQLLHKTGDIGEMLGDVGIVTMPNGHRYIICVMVKRNWNDYSARALINSISSTVYNSFVHNNL